MTLLENIFFLGFRRIEFDVKNSIGQNFHKMTIWKWRHEKLKCAMSWWNFGQFKSIFYIKSYLASAFYAFWNPFWIFSIGSFCVNLHWQIKQLTANQPTILDVTQIWWRFNHSHLFRHKSFSFICYSFSIVCWMHK